MIDFATLTGACVYALTERMSGVFTNRDAARRELHRGRAGAAASASGRSRSTEDYDADIESKVADVMQCALEGKGDHILATRFLSALRAGRTCPGRTWICPPPRAAADWRT